MDGNDEVLRFVDKFRYKLTSGYVRIEYDILMVEYDLAPSVDFYCALAVHCKTSSMIKTSTHLVRFEERKIDKEAILKSETLANPVPVYIGFGGFRVTPLADPHEAEHSIEAYLLNYLSYIPSIKFNFPIECRIIPTCITFRNLGASHYLYHYIIYALLIDIPSIGLGSIVFGNTNTLKLLDIKKQKGLKATTPLFMLTGFCFGRENFGFILDYHFVSNPALHIFGTENCDIGFYQMFKTLLSRSFYILSFTSTDLDSASVTIHPGDWDTIKVQMKGFLEGI